MNNKLINTIRKISLTESIRHLLIIIFVYLSIPFILNVTPAVFDFEGSMYEARFSSLLQDFDINLINNVEPQLSLVISRTGNLPDMHDWGSPLVLAIFDKVFSNMGIIDTSVTHYPLTHTYTGRYVSAFLTQLFFLSLIFYLLSEAGKKLFTHYNSLSNVLLFFLAGTTSIILCEFSNADIIASFFSIYLFSIIFHSNSPKSIVYYIALGFIAGYARFSKISFLFQLLPFMCLMALKSKPRKIARNLLFFIFGFASVYFYLIINDFIAYGRLNFLQGYSYPYSFDYLINLNVYWKTFLGAGGIFIGTPILLLSLVYFFYLVLKSLKTKSLEEHEKIYLIFYISPLIKFGLGTVSIITGYQGFGLRQFTLDYLVFYLLICYLLNVRLKKARYLLYALALWTTVNFIWWILLRCNYEVYNSYYIQNFHSIITECTNIISRQIIVLQNIVEYSTANLRLLLPIVFLYILFLLFKKFWRSKNTVLILGATLFLLVTLSTALNGRFNDINTDNYFKTHSYIDKTIADGGNVFIYDEVLSTMVLGLEIEKIDRNPIMFEYRKKIFKSYLQSVYDEILYDGTHLKRTNPIKNSLYFNDDFSINQSLDYNLPQQFNLPSYLKQD